MKKKPAWVIIVLLAVFLIMYFIPVSTAKQETINANFDNTHTVLSNFTGWAKWNPAVMHFYKDPSEPAVSGNEKNRTFSNKKDSISIKEINPLAFNVAGSIDAEIFSYNFSLIPSQNTYTITVALRENTRLLYSLLPFLKKPSEGEKALDALKKYLENSYNIYGFTINIEKTINDTVYAVMEATVAKEKVFKTMQQRFDLLNKYVQIKGLTKTGFFSISYIPRNDSVFLITGFKVNKPSAALLQVHCVNIPKGNMLTATFKGHFYDRDKIYAALEKYRKDHYLESVGSPIESYIDNKIPVYDSSVVNFKLYYPIR